MASIELRAEGRAETGRFAFSRGGFNALRTEQLLIQLEGDMKLESKAKSEGLVRAN